MDSGELLSNITLRVSDSPGTNPLTRKLRLYDNMYISGVSTISEVTVACDVLYVCLCVPLEKRERLNYQFLYYNELHNSRKPIW